MYIGKTRSPVVVILLSIVTCGIYGLFWYYTIMQDINLTLAEERLSPGLLLFLAIICPPVAWYILYKVDEGLAEVCAEEQINYKSNFILWLLLSFVIGVGIFVAMVQITGAFNQLWMKRAGTTV